MAETLVAEGQLPLDNVGARLARAREASGMSRAQLSNVTKIPERHLAAIEASDFSALPARTYAVGFSRSVAKALGLDDREVVDAVRVELANQEPPPLRGIPAFEPGDPARVPGARFAWIAALAALVVIVAGVAFAWRSYYAPAGELPSILSEPNAAAPAAAPPPVAVAAPAPANGPVVFTAQAPAVWVKFTDGSGKQLLQKELQQGEAWTVPQDVADVKLWTAHPEALAITIGGQPVPKLSDVQKTVRDVPVTASALLARAAVPAATVVPASAQALPVPTPAGT
ncbi:cytoskeletal protein RodZ [Novosphingobium kunmingense]|uniref:Cytoskeletal protein RodZ n=1 Tax=Novosphingobium kunmingense TaxID=1211806 RepID=A0A2N0H713_9SPHN|nr:helix-turn-helix domain-containing protein [Novosphingobium kunmingense]PKB14722.1 cytoskeletal protein RodZ [Novosphingobium kunmingense]